MDYVVTLTGGDSYIVPDTAVSTQRKVHGAKIATILPVDFKPLLPEQLPSAIQESETKDIPSATVDINKMNKQQITDYCISNVIPPSVWKDVKNVFQLRKKVKEYEQSH